MILLRVPLACFNAVLVLILGVIATAWAAVAAFHTTLAGGSVRDALRPRHRA
jgi:hypothetical protein